MGGINKFIERDQLTLPFWHKKLLRKTFRTLAPSWMSLLTRGDDEMTEKFVKYFHMSTVSNNTQPPKIHFLKYLSVLNHKIRLPACRLLWTMLIRGLWIFLEQRVSIVFLLKKFNFQTFFTLSKGYIWIKVHWSSKKAFDIFAYARTVLLSCLIFSTFVFS